jgi:NAD(P)-dependent dehydrogenase (short-subunit alcohol dehydrogenase family)
LWADRAAWGQGTALAVARAGAAHVTIVGRSRASGQAAQDRIQQESTLSLSSASNAKIAFVAGDIGSLASSHQLVADLEEHVKQTGGNRFDFLVVTAAVFPDWSKPHQQEDGIDQCFFIGTVGRYIIYKNMARFMNVDVDAAAGKTKNENVRVLNVMASGQPLQAIPTDLATGKRDAKNMFESVMTFATGNELMLRILQEDTNTSSLGTTRVSTHPGWLKTDLHRGQGWFMDLAEFVAVSLKGFSIEYSGMMQASILASPLLPKGQQSYVSSDMRGRLMHPSLVALQQTQQPWLKDLLDGLLVVDQKN